MSAMSALGDIAADVFNHPAFKAIIALFIYVVSYLFPSRDLFTTVAMPILLLLFMDTITRFALSVKTKEVDDRVIAKSGMKLFIYCCYIIMGRIVDHDLPGQGQYATFAFKSFIIGTECLAITATLGKLGVPLPPKLLKYFSAFTDDGTEIKK